MKNYAKSGIRKGKIAYRTPSRLRVKQVHKVSNINTVKISDNKYAASSN